MCVKEGVQGRVGEKVVLREQCSQTRGCERCRSLCEGGRQLWGMGNEVELEVLTALIQEQQEQARS